jgi:hypothetical protein
MTVGDDDITEVDDLYALDPDAFVAARNDLVRRLRAAGRRDEATAVAGRRRPTPTVWALNQVARHDPALVTRALAAGADLRRATEAAVAGDATALRDAATAERTAGDALVDAAAPRLGPRGHALRGRLAATLRAAVLDDRVGAELRQGTLELDHDAPGFGLEGLAAVPVRPRPRATDARVPAAAPASPEAEPAGPTAREERKAAAARRREEQEAEREQRRRRAQREAEAHRLEQRAERLARAADDAEAAARHARAEADAAAHAALDARRAADAE